MMFNFILASTVPTECNAIIHRVFMGGQKSLGGFLNIVN